MLGLVVHNEFRNTVWRKVRVNQTPRISTNLVAFVCFVTYNSNNALYFAQNELR